MDKLNKINKIPQETLDELENILSKIENAIGDIYGINLVHLDKRKNDSDYNLLTIGNFYNSNISIEIYDSVSEYKDLDGIYNNWHESIIRTYNTFNVTIIEDLLFNKHNEERFNLIHIDDIHYVGTCRKCNKWVINNTYKSGINLAEDYYYECQVCGELWSEYKYYKPLINYNNFTIYNSHDELIAKFKVTRSKSNNSSN